MTKTIDANLLVLADFGQIEEGDYLLIYTSIGAYIAKAKEVIRSGEPSEEIVINKRKNHYFILSMYFENKSWVKNVIILKGFLPYKKGHVKGL
jgi:hypothetical protein